MFGKSFLGTEQDKTEKIVVQGHRNTKRPVSGEAEESDSDVIIQW